MIEKEEKKITTILTTSPTPSLPSTELISSILHSFTTHCPRLLKSPIIVVFDTTDKISANPRLKRGEASLDTGEKYALYRENVKRLVLSCYSHCPSQENRDPQDERESQESQNYQGGTGTSESGTTTTDTDTEVDEEEEKEDMKKWTTKAEYGLPYPTNEVELSITQTKNGGVTFITPSTRLGFGLAVRSALRLVQTEYVWVQQHDWVLVEDIPVADLLGVMSLSSSSSTSSSSISQETSITGSTGSQSSEEKEVSPTEENIPIKYITFPSIRTLTYTKQPYVLDFPLLRNYARTLTGTFTAPSGAEVPLTPLFFWFDKPHIAQTKHYLERVFPNRLAMRRGEFIEDKIGQVARGQMKEGLWERWACWLFYPEDGRKLCLRHLQGRTWRGEEGDLLRRFGYGDL
ncbi:hypothetical protein BDV25DRAFT_143125 [Aspergillus avenaceus]|uniref:Uncharacterized protein n=1 Tax=Aspergillus avenaceus TaxID=36643 RepID=A0A5N6TLQ3_ASPAV|nr:hypothetical protein BDV25DRAFT_143125 [Aspergillus avenaceus]